MLAMQTNQVQAQTMKNSPGPKVQRECRQGCPNTFGLVVYIQKILSFIKSFKMGTQ